MQWDRKRNTKNMKRRQKLSYLKMIYYLLQEPKDIYITWEIEEYITYIFLKITEHIKDTKLSFMYPCWEQGKVSVSKQYQSLGAP